MKKEECCCRRLTFYFVCGDKKALEHLEPSSDGTVGDVLKDIKTSNGTGFLEYGYWKCDDDNTGPYISGFINLAHVIRIEESWEIDESRDTDKAK